MQIDAAMVEGARVVRPHGRVDSATSAVLEQALKTDGPTRLLLDLSDVPYMSSAGLRVVLMAAKAARASGGGFAVFGLSKPVRDVFQMSGFDRIVPIAASEADALATPSS